MTLSQATLSPNDVLFLSRAALYGEARAELSAISDELNRRRWLRDPVLWARERLGLSLWSKQEEILRSVSRNRKTCVRSCHGMGKSFIAGNCVAWWIDVHPPGTAMAVTTAPSNRQVRVILWKEIRQSHAAARLPGRTNQTEWLMTMPNGEELTVAIGMKPSDYSPTAFQGIHARFVLVVLDEACGIPGKTDDRPQSLWESSDSLLANEDCRVLAIGNPDEAGTEFANINKPGSGWKTLSISAFDTPNFTGEVLPEPVLSELISKTWVEEKRRAWAPTWKWNASQTRVIPPEGFKLEDAHPLWVSKVLGEFPTSKTASGLIPPLWIAQAQERRLRASHPIELGVDVGGGGDASVIALRKGPVVRVVLEDHNPDTMSTCGNVIDHLHASSAREAKVDSCGIGKGLCDRGREQNLPFTPVNVGCRSTDPERFLNFRAEAYWSLRERFESGDIDIDPLDEQLAAELCSIRFRRNSRGQIQIEEKETAKRRGIPSPNRADAVCLSFATPPPVQEELPPGGLLW